MSDTTQLLHDFIDNTGLYFDGMGLPATSGRILGHLLTCPDPVQSSSELAAALETTSGSISTNTRLLLGSGMIEKVPVRGRRGVFFRVAPDAYDRMLAGQVDKVRAFRELLDMGLEALGSAPPEQKARLRDFWELYSFLEEEFPKLMARFEQRRGSRADVA